MIPHEAVAALARSTAALTTDHDVVGTAATLCREAVTALGARSAGLLLVAGNDRLEPLAASSHAVGELELYQVQVGEGPCVDVVHSGQVVAEVGADAVRARWPVIGQALVEAGYRALHASPLRWRGDVIGALNVFWDTEVAMRQEVDSLTQAFADLATLVVVHGAVAPRFPDLARQVEEALTGRTALERAKGVVAQVDGVPVEEAYARLVRRADDEGRPLTEVAVDVLRRTSRRPGGRDPAEPG